MQVTFWGLLWCRSKWDPSLWYTLCVRRRRTQEYADFLTLVLNYNHAMSFFCGASLGRLQHDARQAFRVSVVDEAPVESIPNDPHAVH